MKILAADFETGNVSNGLVDEEGAGSKLAPGPVTLGVAVMEGETVIESKEWLFAPVRGYRGELRRSYSDEATAIHGYSLEQMERDGLSVARVLDELGAFARKHKAISSKVVAFNSPFDLPVYSDCLFLAGGKVDGKFRHHFSPLLGPWHCAAILSREMIDGLKNYKLDTVAAHFGLARSTEKHGAEEDAILAGRIYHQLQQLRLERLAIHNTATTTPGPMGDAQRALADCAIDTPEYLAALDVVNELQKSKAVPA